MTTPLSRRGFTHPAQGAAGDATLYTQIETLYKTIGDDLATRWLRATAVTNTSTVTLTHGFRIPFANFKYAVYSGSTSNDDGTTDYTKITSGITVVANGTNPTTQIDVTNTTGGTIANLRVLIWCERGQLSDNNDIDFSTSPQDGQALVYNASTGKWLPGASGDASFKLQSITSDVLTLKGGHLVLGDDRELATFDGGSTYGGDITVNLLTLLATPSNGQTYYLYIDLDTLGAAVLDESVNREIYGVTVSNMVLSTSTPRNMNKARYRGVGLVVGIAANHYSTTAFKTLGVRYSNNGPAVVSPVVSRPATGGVISAVGTAGQLAAGHILTTKSWPSGLTQASQLAYWNLAANGNDNGPQGKNLTGVSSPTFGATGILGGATATTLNGTSQYLHSSDAFFNPGPGVSFAYGGWFKQATWGAGNPALIFNINNGTDRGFGVDLTGGNINFQMTNNNISSSVSDVSTAIPFSFANNSWHHFAFVFNFATTTWTAYVDGKAVATGSQSNQRSLTTSDFKIGADSSTPSDFFGGQVEEVFFVKGYALTDNDIRKLVSYRYDHNASVSALNQRWNAKIYPIADGDSFQPSAGWLVGSSDSNSVFWDFSDLGATDTVDVYLEDMGLSPNVVSTVPPFDTTYTSTPPGTVAHGQPDIPDVVLLVETGTAGQWDQIPSEGKIQADATNLTIDLSALSPAVGVSPNRVRIIARPSRLASVGVPDATTARTGSVTAARQNFAGLKGFLGGFYGVSNVRASEGAGTTTLTDDDNRSQDFNLSAARTVILPTTSIKSGDTWTIANRGAFALSVQSSNTNALASFLVGRVVFRALQDTPTTSAHWELIDWYEEGTWTPVISATVTPFTTVAHTTQVGTYTRSGRMVHFTCFVAWNGTTGTASGTLQVTGLPYTSKNLASNIHAFAIGDYANIDTGSSTQPVIGAEIAPNANVMSIQKMGNLTNDNGVVANSNGGAVARLMVISGSYNV